LASWVPEGFDAEEEFRLAEEAIYEHAEVVGRTDSVGDYPAFLKMRKSGLGASDAAPALGLSKWGSPFSVWADKTTEEVDGSETEGQKWGRRLEEPIMLGVAQDNGIPVRRFPFMLRSKQYPFMTANLDGISRRSNVEVKMVDRFAAPEWDNGQVPMWYTVQGQHSNLVTGHEGTHFFALIGGNDQRVVYVPRNDDLIENLIKAERKFWELVQSLTPPEADALAATTDALKRVYGNPDAGSEVELPPEAIALAANRKASKEAIKEHQEIIDGIENQFRLWLGNAETGKVGDISVVSWKHGTRKGYLVPEWSGRTFNFPKPKPPKGSTA
jgi:putative phage-type endonuclease